MASGKVDYFFPDISLTPLLAKMDENLVKLDAITAKLSIGEDLIDSLDMLDGTMDDRLTLGQLDTSNVVTNLATIISEELTLSQLNTSNVVTNLATIITRLDTSITKLTNQITQLLSIATSTEQGSKFGYMKVDTSADTLLDYRNTTMYNRYFLAKTHVSNTADITFILKRDTVTKQTFVLSPGGYRYHYESAGADFWNWVTVVAASGEQHFEYSFTSAA